MYTMKYMSWLFAMLFGFLQIRNQNKLRTLVHGKTYYYHIQLCFPNSTATIFLCYTMSLPQRLLYFCKLKSWRAGMRCVMVLTPLHLTSGGTQKCQKLSLCNVNDKLESYRGTCEARGKDYIDVEFRFLFPTPKDRLMEEAQESLALSPELSLVKGSISDLEYRSKIMWAREWENKEISSPRPYFFHKLLIVSVSLPVSCKFQADVIVRQFLSRSLSKK